MQYYYYYTFQFENPIRVLAIPAGMTDPVKNPMTTRNFSALAVLGILVRITTIV